MRCTCCLFMLTLWSAAAGCNNRMPMCIGSFSLHSKWIGLSKRYPNSSVLRRDVESDRLIGNYYYRWNWPALEGFQDNFTTFLLEVSSPSVSPTHRLCSKLFDSFDCLNSNNLKNHLKNTGQQAKSTARPPGNVSVLPMASPCLMEGDRLWARAGCGEG